MKHRIIAAAVLAAVLCLALLAACGSGEPPERIMKLSRRERPAVRCWKNSGSRTAAFPDFSGIFTIAGIKWSSFTMKATTAAMPQQ